MTSAPRTLGRRFVVPGALASAAVVGTAGTAAAADEDLAAYAPARFKGKDKLLSRNDRHLVSRFSYGVTPSLARDVRTGGRRPGMVREAAQAEHGQGQEGRPAPVAGGRA